VATVARLRENVTKGAWGTVDFAVLESGKIPAKEFFDEEMSVAERASFLDVFQNMADFGVVPSKRFHTMGKISAFRDVKSQIRFPCFRDENRWILTHGFFKPGARNKKKGKWPTTEIVRAKGIHEEYLARKKLLEVPPRGKQ
jgi:hypothetical protein